MQTRSSGKCIKYWSQYGVHAVPHSMHLNVNELAILVDGSATGIASDRSKSGPKQGFLKVEV